MILRLLKSDSAFALAIILPTLAGVALIGALEFAAMAALKGALS